MGRHKQVLVQEFEEKLNMTLQNTSWQEQARLIKYQLIRVRERRKILKQEVKACTKEVNQLESKLMGVIPDFEQK